MKLELFMTIPEYENYKISTYGKVINIKRNKEKQQRDRGHGYYVVTLHKNGRAKTFTIHRLVAHTFFDEDITNKEIDHIDGVKNNNFIKNLRVCNSQQNKCNKGKQKNNTSGLKGVSWKSGRKKWNASIQVNKKSINLGNFNTKEEAYEKYKEAARYYHGEYCYQYL